MLFIEEILPVVLSILTIENSNQSSVLKSAGAGTAAGIFVSDERRYSVNPQLHRN